MERRREEEIDKPLSGTRITKLQKGKNA